jgi:hypothetical protein
MATAAAMEHIVSPHRVYARSYLLTFAGLTPRAISPADMIAAVEAWGTEVGVGRGKKGILEWLGAIEIHEQPARQSHDHHWHVYLHFESRVDITDPRRYKQFDIKLADNTVAHPHIRKVNPGAADRYATLQYVAKQQDGDHPKLYGRMVDPVPCFAENYQLHAEGDAQADDNPTPVAKKPRAATWGDDLNECSTKAECERMLRLNHATVYYMHWSQISKNLDRRFRPTFPHRHTLEEFTMTLRDFNVDWMAGPIVVTGATGLGKTTWVAAHARNPLVIKNIEDARDYEQGFHDLLILDDVNFKTSKPEWAISLLDFDLNRTVDARYSPVRIPSNVPMIFTTNYPMNNLWSSIFPQGNNADQQEAIDRRFKIVRVATSLFIT